MKKIIVFCLAVVLVVAMAAPAWAVTPAFKAPKMPKIPEVKTNIQLKVTEGYWSRWFQINPININEEDSMSIKIYNKSKDGYVQLSKNFKVREFACKCPRCSIVKVDTELVDILQRIRDYFGEAVNINSGYRCEEHNAEVGGASGSHHTKGMAADIRVEGIAPREVAKYAESIGVKRIGLYEGDEGEFVHIGSDKSKRFWLGHGIKIVDTFGGAKEQICTLSLPVLKRGSKGGSVEAVQLILQGHTNPRLMADGSFGPATELEVKEYQEKVGLSVDGSVGPATWAKLLGV